MVGLSNIAKSISIGDGSALNFWNYASRWRMNGGLFYYTTANGLRRANLINNYNAGAGGRYGYSYGSNGDIKTGNFKWFDGTNTGLTTMDYVARGESYDAGKKNTNSDKLFLTTEDFTAFQGILRDDNLINNRDESYVTEKYGISTTANIGKHSMERGDQYSVGNIVAPDTHDTVETSGYEYREKLLAYEKNLKDKIGSNRGLGSVDGLGDENYLGKTFSGQAGEFSTTFASDKYTKLKSLKNAASERRERLLSNNRGIHPIIARNTTSKYFNIGNYGAGEEVSLPDDIGYDTEVGKRLTESGLFEYYSSERDKYNTKFSTLKYPWDISSNKSVIWTRNNPYGVDSQKGLESYGDGISFSGVTISPDFKGGENVSTNPSTGNRTYSYFQEAEKGVVPGTLNTGDSIADDSSVVLSDYSGASRLLKRTNELFRTAKIGSLINRFHTCSGTTDSEVISSYDKNFGMSRGRNLIKKQYEGKQSGDMSSGYDNPYCRVWTAHHQYSKLSDRIRPFYGEDGPLSIKEIQSNYGTMRPGNGSEKLNNYSVLRSDGFIRVTPTHKDGKLYNDNDSLKNYMFSIENLAWKDVAKRGGLSEEQIGPNGGRIMWFPPYNLKFSEQVNTQWNGNNFIGRGEQIYTYVNTERSGNLSFTILIDHPSELNSWRGMAQNVSDKEGKEKDILRYFAGCGDLTLTQTKTETQTVDDGAKNGTLRGRSRDIAYVVFFPNCYSAYDYLQYGDIEGAIDKIGQYEVTGGKEMRDYDKSPLNIVMSNNPFINKNESLYHLNEGNEEEETLVKQMLFGAEDREIEIHYLKGEHGLEHLEDEFNDNEVFGFDARTTKIDSIDIKGFGSTHEYNEIADKRRLFIRKAIEDKCFAVTEDNTIFNELDGQLINMDGLGFTDEINGLDPKVSRAAYAIFHLAWKEDVYPEYDNEENVRLDNISLGIRLEDENIDEDSKEGWIDFYTNKAVTSDVTIKVYYNAYGSEEEKLEVITIPKGSTEANKVLILSSKDANGNISIINDITINGGRGGVALDEESYLYMDKDYSTDFINKWVSAGADSIVRRVEWGSPWGTYTVRRKDSGTTIASASTVSREVVINETVVSDYTYDNEYKYFAEIRDNKIVHKNIVDKVRYFNPAYHSITPEGFNSRLTFLHQCTRQGPTNAVSAGITNTSSDDYLKYAGNLAFGRAPYCILRIGDFFNTKICIENISIEYDDNGVSWDMNPEGIGVQPMFANINIAFKFFGGQDLTGPIERLQNAVTANYYANASVYDRHADDKNWYYDAYIDNLKEEE